MIASDCSQKFLQFLGLDFLWYPWSINNQTVLLKYLRLLIKKKKSGILNLLFFCFFVFFLKVSEVTSYVIHLCSLYFYQFLCGLDFLIFICYSISTLSFQVFVHLVSHVLMNFSLLFFYCNFSHFCWALWMSLRSWLMEGKFIFF